MQENEQVFESANDTEIDHNLLTQAWLKNKLSLDTGLFALSGGAIAVLVCLMSLANIGSTLTLVFYIIAVLCFMLSLALSVYIYKGNSNYIEKLKQNLNASDELLPVLDKVCITSFLIGLVFIVFIGVFSACQNMQSHTTTYKIESTV